MTYTQSKENCEIKVVFKVEITEWKEAIKAAYEETKNKFNIPGFRPGKAPQKTVESIYGEGVFYDDAFNIAFSKAYTEFLAKETEVEPIAQPDVSIDDLNDEGVTFSAVVTVKPEFEMPKYKGLKVVKASEEIFAEDIEKDILQARERVARLVEVNDRAVKDGDTTVIDYSGSVDGEIFEGGTAEKQTLVIGSGSFIPGFEEQVVGMNIGESRDIKVSFPTEYHSEKLAGKDAVFAITLHEIKEKVLPELNDEFVKDTTAFDTVEDYKESISKKLKEQKAASAANKLENDLLEALTAKAEIEIPQVLIDEQIDYMLQDFEMRLRYQGMKIEDYFKYTNSSEEDFRAQRADEAKKAVKTRLVIEKLIKTEKIEASDEDVDAKMAEMAAKVDKTLEEYKKTVKKQQIGYIKNEIIMDKVMEILKSNAKFEE